MSALPPEQMQSMRASADQAGRPISHLAQQWKALHETAAQLAGIANISPEVFDSRLAAFPELLGDANGWQQTLAWQGVDDIDAMMRPGLAALGAITARGQDASAPALALWREFHHARDAVLAVVQPNASQPQ
ncbi:MAG: hypothetical protein ABJN35_12130 [Erythrobacter sp.]